MIQAKLVGANQPSLDGLWNVEFDMIVNNKVISVFTSATLFKTDVDALEAGERALAEFNKTQQFPNMCESF